MCDCNPIRWESRKVLTKAAVQHVLDSGSQVTLVECAIGERPFEHSGIPGVNFVGVRASGDSLVWTKECLQMIGIQSASRLGADYFHLMDADIIYRRPYWPSEIVQTLQHNMVIQPWEHCYDLGPQGQHLEVHTSLGSLFHQNKPIMQGPKCGPNTPYRFGHPGYSTAWRREALDAVGGLIETAAAGAADHHMMMGLIGRVMDSVPLAATAGYVAPLRIWQDRAIANIKFNIGYMPGTIEHSWHGDKKKRGYSPRWGILIKNEFDPTTDLTRNTYGVVELAGNKPQLRHDIDLYLRSRDEDSNTLAA